MFPRCFHKVIVLRRCVMELLALTAWAAMVTVRTKRQKEAELAARERRSMKRRRRIWVKKCLLRRVQFGQYDKRKYFGRRKAAVALRKVTHQVTHQVRSHLYPRRVECDHRGSQTSSMKNPILVIRSFCR